MRVNMKVNMGGGIRGIRHGEWGKQGDTREEHSLYHVRAIYINEYIQFNSMCLLSKLTTTTTTTTTTILLRVSYFYYYC